MSDKTADLREGLNDILAALAPNYRQQCIDEIVELVAASRPEPVCTCRSYHLEGCPCYNVPVPWAPVTHWRPLPDPPAASGKVDQAAHTKQTEALAKPSGEQPKETRYVCRGCGAYGNELWAVIHRDDCLVGGLVEPEPKETP